MESERGGWPGRAYDQLRGGKVPRIKGSWRSNRQVKTGYLPDKTEASLLMSSTNVFNV